MNTQTSILSLLFYSFIIYFFLSFGIVISPLEKNIFFFSLFFPSFLLWKIFYGASLYVPIYLCLVYWGNKKRYSSIFWFNLMYSLLFFITIGFFLQVYYNAQYFLSQSFILALGSQGSLFILFIVFLLELMGLFYLNHLFYTPVWSKWFKNISTATLSSTEDICIAPNREIKEEIFEWEKFINPSWSQSTISSFQSSQTALYARPSIKNILPYFYPLPFELNIASLSKLASDSPHTPLLSAHTIPSSFIKNSHLDENEFHFPTLSSPLPSQTIYTPSVKLDSSLYEEKEIDEKRETELLKNHSQLIEKTLEEFKISGKITHIQKGPSIYCFEYLPSSGIRLSRIVALEDNLALRLAASHIRVVAPIPGKNTVGIEIPREKKEMVDFAYVKDNLSQNQAHLPIILGKKINGDLAYLALEKAPHLLIAGATGSGKSICINTLICSLIENKSPYDLRFILIDPKIVELQLYHQLPHLLCPVITEVKSAIKILEWLQNEMLERYQILNNYSVRDIDSYNQKIKQDTESKDKPLPYIVLIIDELADFLLTAPKNFETLISRLAAMSRAVGIHLVLATQRPSVDILTGVIKANFPSRIAFMVASKFDSRTILDMVGAEQLLGKGDMLFLSSASPYPERLQGAFVSENSILQSIRNTHHWGQFPQLKLDEDTPAPNQDIDDDPLLNQAIQIVQDSNRASASYLQRRLRIGYNKAALFIELMEDKGLVGPQNGSKPREVYAPI